MIRRIAVLSNLRRSPSSAGLLLACLLLPLSGCAGGQAPASPSPDPHAADRRLIPADLFWSLPDGARIPVRAWLPPPGQTRAIVLALHGIDDSRDAWELPAPALAAAGLAVYAPDQRGFGEAPGRGTWPGSERLVDDAAAMVRILTATRTSLPTPTPPIIVMGESMGGAVALCLAARPDHPAVAGFVLLAPAVWSSTEMNPALTASLWAAATFAPDWQLTGRELPLHVQASDNLAALYRLSYDPLTLKGTRTASLRGLVELMTRAASAAPHIHNPVLIAYGAHDQLVPPAAMAANWARLPASARRAYYPHGYHLLLRDQDRGSVIADIAGWIANPATALPSGADIAAAAWTAGASWQTGVPPILPANLDDLAGTP